MKKRAIIAAAVCAVILAGCGSTDMSGKYKKELAYTLGSGYTCEEIAPDYEDYDCPRWEITYTDRNGKQRTGTLSSRKFGEFEREVYKDKAQMEESLYYGFVADEALTIATDDMLENIVSKYIDVGELSDDLVAIYESGECKTVLTCYHTLSIYKDTREGIIADAEHMISPKTGIRLCDYGLKDMAQDKTAIIGCNITLKDGVDPEEYIEKLDGMVRDFEKYTEAPMNYYFILKDSERNKLYDQCKLLGEAVDYYEVLEEYKGSTPDGKGSFSSLILDRLYGPRTE